LIRLIKRFVQIVLLIFAKIVFFFKIVFLFFGWLLKNCAIMFYMYFNLHVRTFTDGQEVLQNVDSNLSFTQWLAVCSDVSTSQCCCCAFSL